MKQEKDKPISNFSEKQRKTYKLAMRSSARKELTNKDLIHLVRESGIYEDDQRAREVVEMRVHNSNTPLKINSDGKIENLVEVG